MRKLFVTLVCLLYASGLWGACTATKQNADYSPVSSSSTVTLSTGTGSDGQGHTSRVNAIGDLVLISAWCYQNCTFPATMTMGSMTATRTATVTPGTTIGIDGLHTGQTAIYYILSASASGNQALSLTVTGGPSQTQLSYVDFGLSAGCTASHHTDSGVGSATGGGTANAPSVSSVSGDVLYSSTVTTQHVNSPVNSPWSCPVYSGSGETQTCNIDVTQNGQAYVLAAGSGTISNNWTLINSSTGYEALISTFTMTQAAANACPSGANYLNAATNAQVTLASLGITTCWYVAASGLDTNSGADEAHPFLHSPGMQNCTNTCAGVALTAGTGIIFRGGDTWHFGNSALAPYGGVVTGCAINGTQAAGLCLDNVNGTSANPIYYGSDATWFSGGAWARQKLTGDNPACNSGTVGVLPGGATCTGATNTACYSSGQSYFGQPCNYVSACRFQIGSANNLVDIGFSKNIIFDNFEVEGLCQSHVGQPGSLDSFINYSSDQAPITLQNNYIHNATHLQYAGQNGLSNCTGGTVCINLNAFYGGVNNGSVGETLSHNVVDFSDSDPGGQNLTQGSGFYNVAYNVFRYTSQALPHLHLFHDNLYEFFFENGHSNAIESTDTSPAAIYNNVFRHIETNLVSGGGVLLWPGTPSSSGIDYIFNNVIYDVGALEYLNFAGLGLTTNSGKYTYFNNTFQSNPSQTIYNCHAANAAVNIINDHAITNGGTYLDSPNCGGQLAGGTPLTPHFTSNATATTEGYTSAQTFGYSPASAGAPTVGTGTNEQALCTAISTAGLGSVATACQSDTTYACSYAGNGSAPVCPARTTVARPASTAWNIGAYQFGGTSQAATPTFSPAAGTFTVGQLVTPSTTSGSVICFTINGTTPATNGTTGCTTGTLFSTALSIGSTTTVKAIAGGTGFTDSTVATATFTINPFNADNLYCPTGTPTWGTVDGPATLPQTCYNTAIANTPATGSVVNVTTAGQLTTALAAAACGQIITLQAGNTFSGTGFTIPALSCPANNYLWIVSSGMSSLPVEGARYSTTYNGTTIYAPEFGPCYSGVTSQLGRAPLFCPSTSGTYTAKIVTTNTNPALTFTTGTSGVRLIGLEFARTDGTGFVAQLIKVGNVGTIDHVIFDRLYCHGNEDLDETSSCINMSAVSNIAVIDSYMPNFFCAAGVGHNSCDAHALWGGGNNINTTPEHTVKIVNNWLEGAAETIEIGGVAANVVPTDFEVRNNMMFKPLQWNPADPSYDGGLAGGQQIVKNLYEHKTGQRVLVEGNYFINNWAQAQDGTAILLVAKNQTGNLCPICAVEDITFRYNYISTASAPFGLVPTSATDGQLFAAQNDLSVHDNVADNIMYPNCYNCGTPTSGAFQIESIYTINTPARVYRNLTINHNTVVHSSTAVLTFYASVWVGGPTIASGLNNTNLVFKNNVFMGGSSGVLNTPGNGHPTNCGEGLAGANTLLTACYSPIVFTNNCILAHGSVVWPTGQLFVATQTAAYANYNNGDNGDYTIAAGACKGAATDGSDPGANLPTLASVLIGNNPVSRQDIPATYFGLHWKIANFPPLVPSGSVRLWDSLTRWQLLNPSNGTYNFTDLDTNLLDAKNINVDVLFALSTTPNFISSDPTNATCNYNSTANGGCGVPTDIAISCTNVNGNHNCDGKTDGTLQSWDLFIYNTLLHIQGLDPNVYQVPSSYEIWNEFTQQGTSGAGTCNQVGGTSWEGTCAQLALLYSHANCIITGRGVGCTAGAMGTPAVGLYPNAIVTTPDSVMTAPQSTQWGAYLQTSGALTNADVASVHAYTQGGSCCALPETVVTRYNTASGLLSTAGGTQPIWSTEGGWGQVASEPDVDLQAAFVARYYLLGWNAGFKRLYWYSYDSLFGTLWTSGGGLTKAGVAYGQIYNWMVGSVLSTPCTAVSTVYSCVLTNATGDHLVMWDTSQTCSGGVCTTSNQPVASTWLAYQDMTTQSIPIAIAASHQVPIGAKPVIFQQSIITHGAGVNPVILGMNRGPK